MGQFLWNPNSLQVFAVGPQHGPQVWAEDTAAAFRSLRGLCQNSRGAEGGSQSLTYEEIRDWWFSGDFKGISWENMGKYGKISLEYR